LRALILDLHGELAGQSLWAASSMIMRALAICIVDYLKVPLLNDPGLEERAVVECFTSVPVVNYGLCNGCAVCALNCPEGALIALPGCKPAVSLDRCISCMKCKVLCDREAILFRSKLVAKVIAMESKELGLRVICIRTSPYHSSISLRIAGEVVLEIAGDHNVTYTTADSPLLSLAIRQAERIIVVADEWPIEGILELIKEYENKMYLILFDQEVYAKVEYDRKILLPSDLAFMPKRFSEVVEVLGRGGIRESLENMINRLMRRL